MNPLGALRKLDVRSIWPNEASDFTPWLAQDENVLLLGTAIGLELEVESIEVAAGPYSADILAREAGSSSYVIIENQLGKTDHDHLGKAITYAAVLDAGSIIWVAPEFTQEHRKAIDWLNDISSGDTAFYGVQIELWQIEDSKPAVRFNVLARPASTLIKAALSKASSELSDTRRLQLEWWTAFSSALVEAKVVPSTQAPGPRYWFNVALGRSGIHLSCIADTSANRIGVRVYMRGKYNADSALSQLVDQKEDIEREVGESLTWSQRDDTSDKVIALYRNANLSLRDDWPIYLEWLVARTDKFRRAFGPRVKALDLDRTSEPYDEL